MNQQDRIAAQRIINRDPPVTNYSCPANVEAIEAMDINGDLWRLEHHRSVDPKNRCPVQLTRLRDGRTLIIPFTARSIMSMGWCRRAFEQAGVFFDPLPPVHFVCFVEDYVDWDRH